jgi:hypothetical protein
MGRHADDEDMGIAMILFIFLVGPFALLHGADSR